MHNKSKATRKLCNMYKKETDKHVVKLTSGVMASSVCEGKSTLTRADGGVHTSTMLVMSVTIT